jgi:hypothetical protein
MSPATCELSLLGAGLTFPSVTAFSPNLSKYGQSGAFTLGEISSTLWFLFGFIHMHPWHAFGFYRAVELKPKA